MSLYNGATFFSWIVIFLQRIFDMTMFSNASEHDEAMLLLLVVLSLSASCVGTLLQHKKKFMYANALTHTSFFGIVIGMVFGSSNLKGMSLGSIQPVFFALCVCMSSFATYYTNRILTFLGVQKDAAVSIVMTLFMSCGVILISFFAGDTRVSIDVITGSLDAVEYNDISLYFAVACCITFITLYFSKYFALTTFASEYSYSLLPSLRFFSLLETLMTTFVIVSGIKTVGIVVIMAMVSVPAIIASIGALSIKQQLLRSISIGVVVSFCSVALSRHVLSVAGIALSTGSLHVVLLFLLYFIHLFINRSKSGVLQT